LAFKPTLGFNASAPPTSVTSDSPKLVAPNRSAEAQIFIADQFIPVKEIVNFCDRDIGGRKAGISKRLLGGTRRAAKRCHVRIVLTASTE